MEPKPTKPLSAFLNPFTLWTTLAIGTGKAILDTAHAAAVARRRKVALIPEQAQPPSPAVKAAPVAKSAAQHKGKRGKTNLRRKSKSKRR